MGESQLVLMDNSTSYAAGVGGMISFGGTYGDDYSQIGASIQGIRESSSSFVDDWGLAFYTSYDNNRLNEVVRFSPGGKCY
jgi:hypothetical protein